MTQVFISYSRKDLAFVERLVKDLKDVGLEVWYDLSGLRAGSRWGMEIQKAIRQSQVFIAVLSPNSVKSEWVEREFLYSSNHKLKIIPLLYKPCDLPMWCLNLHFIDFRGRNYKLHFPELLKALGIQPGEKVEKIKSAVEVNTMQAISGSQKLFPQMVEAEAEKAPPPQIQLPFEHKPAVKEKTPQREKPPRKELMQPRRKIKIRPAWILLPVGLVAVIAFAVWGMPQNNARLGLPPVPTMTAMHTSISTGTYTLTPTQFNPPTLTRTPSPSPTLEIGSQWVSPVDDMAMVYVPEGDFNMGSDSDRLDEQPVHMVYLDAFWIDQTEVTNRMYALCVAGGSCQLPTSSSSLPSHYGDPESDNYPVIYVSWDMAEAYCRWAGRRLPTEAEWEKAARGTDGRTYPWGNSSPTCALASLVSLGYGTSPCLWDTTAVGSYPAGASPYGALDMAGNAWEWVNDWYSATYYSQSPGSNPTGPVSGDYRVMRGVSWSNNVDSVRSAYRFRGNLTDYSPHAPGFRCARDAEP